MRPNENSISKKGITELKEWIAKPLNKVKDKAMKRLIHFVLKDINHVTNSWNEEKIVLILNILTFNIVRYKLNY